MVAVSMLCSMNDPTANTVAALPLFYPVKLTQHLCRRRWCPDPVLKVPVQPGLLSYQLDKAFSWEKESSFCLVGQKTRLEFSPPGLDLGSPVHNFLAVQSPAQPHQVHPRIVFPCHQSRHQAEMFIPVSTPFLLPRYVFSQVPAWPS